MQIRKGMIWDILTMLLDISATMLIEISNGLSKCEKKQMSVREISNR